MSVAKALDQFRDSLPACELVVLADLPTEIVLASSADMQPSQERLDALTAEASAAIPGPVGEGASILLEGEPPAPHVAVIAGPAQTRIFVAAAGDRAEALLISLPTGSPLQRIFDCAEDVLADILARN